MDGTKEGIDIYTIIVEVVNAPCSLIGIINRKNFNNGHTGFE